MGRLSCCSSYKSKKESKVGDIKGMKHGTKCDDERAKMNENSSVRYGVLRSKKETHNN